MTINSHTKPILKTRNITQVPCALFINYKPQTRPKMFIFMGENSLHSEHKNCHFSGRCQSDGLYLGVGIGLSLQIAPVCTFKTKNIANNACPYLIYIIFALLVTMWTKTSVTNPMKPTVPVRDSLGEF
jgi:hypothetical protein